MSITILYYGNKCLDIGIRDDSLEFIDYRDVKSPEKEHFKLTEEYGKNPDNFKRLNILASFDELHKLKDHYIITKKGKVYFVDYLANTVIENLVQNDVMLYSLIVHLGITFERMLEVYLNVYNLCSVEKGSEAEKFSITYGSKLVVNFKFDREKSQVVLDMGRQEPDGHEIVGRNSVTIDSDDLWKIMKSGDKDRQIEKVICNNLPKYPDKERNSK